MNLFVIVLGVGLAIRTILDLSTLNKSSVFIDVLYFVLYCALGLVVLIRDHTDIFGYLMIAIGFAWGVYGLVKYVRASKRQSKS